MLGVFFIERRTSRIRNFAFRVGVPNATTMSDPLEDRITGATEAISALQSTLLARPETDPPYHVEELRDFVHSMHTMLSSAQTSLALRIVLNDEHQRTTRSDYLLTLSERIGPEPMDRTWEDEWDALTQEEFGRGVSPGGIRGRRRRGSEPWRSSLPRWRRRPLRRPPAPA